MCTAHRHGLAPCKRPELSHGLSMHATVPTLPHATSARKASGARNDGVAATAFELPAAACSVCDMFSSCLATSAPALASASALTLPVRPRAQCAGQQAPLCACVHNGRGGRADTCGRGQAEDGTGHSTTSRCENISAMFQAPIRSDLEDCREPVGRPGHTCAC